jgi:hypothetical protein
MPYTSIMKLLPDIFGDAKFTARSASCELYLPAENPAAMSQRAVNAGGKELSAAAQRSWGDIVAYAADLDGHVLAFAKTPMP